MAHAWPQGYGWLQDTAILPGSTTLPSNCQEKQVFIKTNGTSGQQFYICIAGTWTLQGGGGSGSGTVSSGTIGQEAVYTGTTTVGSGIITDNGTNVGIGSVNPTQALDVNGTVKATAFVAGTGTATITGSGSNILLASGGGNVGIGTLTPGKSLDIQGSVRINGLTNGIIFGDGTSMLTAASGGGTPANPTGTIGLSAVNGSASTYMRSDGAPALGVTISPTWTGNHIFAPSSGNTVFTAGNVGIGSATPGQALDVVGTLRVTSLGTAFTITGANVGIGSATPGQVLDVTGTARTTQLIISGIATDSGKTDATICEDTTTHQVYSGSGTLGICLGTSSARYKHDINLLGLGLGAITKLKPVTFFYKNGYGDNGARLQYGLLAEDVSNVIPNLVSLDKDNRPNSVDLLGMTPILINAVQEQQNEINIIGIFLLLISILMILFRKK